MFCDVVVVVAAAALSMMRVMMLRCCCHYYEIPYEIRACCWTVVRSESRASSCARSAFFIRERARMSRIS